VLGTGRDDGPSRDRGRQDFYFVFRRAVPTRLADFLAELERRDPFRGLADGEALFTRWARREIAGHLMLRCDQVAANARALGLPPPPWPVRTYAPRRERWDIETLSWVALNKDAEPPPPAPPADPSQDDPQGYGDKMAAAFAVVEAHRAELAAKKTEAERVAFVASTAKCSSRYVYRLKRELGLKLH
jgi:hypothetical protein